MKTTKCIVLSVTRTALGIALLATIGIGLAIPVSAHRNVNGTAVTSAPAMRLVDGTESNGGKGDKPKKRQIGQMA